jgi:jumonji domain-containing protein 2
VLTPLDPSAVLPCSLTINPPLYGADTPMSLFDEKLPYGWNLRDLGCLLKQPHIPQVPGVTTPMTYFGMWKSFFAWHVVSRKPGL